MTDEGTGAHVVPEDDELQGEDGKELAEGGERGTTLDPKEPEADVEMKNGELEGMADIPSRTGEQEVTMPAIDDASPTKDAPFCADATYRHAPEPYAGKGKEKLALFRAEEKAYNRLLEADKDVKDWKEVSGAMRGGDKRLKSLEATVERLAMTYARATKMRVIHRDLDTNEAKLMEIGKAMIGLQKGPERDIWAMKRVGVEAELERLKERKEALTKPAKKSKVAKKQVGAKDPDFGSKSRQFQIDIECTILTFQTVRAEAEMETYAETGNIKAVSSTSQRFIRHVGSAVPIAVMKNRKLAKAVVTTNRRSTRCRYHEGTYSGHSEVDTEDAFDGRAYPEDLTGPPMPNHMNCGCLLEDELLSLYLWKLIRIKSSNPAFQGMSKPQEHEDVPNTRERAIQCETFKAFAGLRLDDMYRIAAEFGNLLTDKEAYIEMRKTQVVNFLGELGALGVHVDVPTLLTGCAQGQSASSSMEKQNSEVNDEESCAEDEESSQAESDGGDE